MFSHMKTRKMNNSCVHSTVSRPAANSFMYMSQLALARRRRVVTRALTRHPSGVLTTTS